MDIWYFLLWGFYNKVRCVLVGIYVWTHMLISLRKKLRSGTAGSWVGVCLTLLEIARGVFQWLDHNKEAFIPTRMSLTIVGTVSRLNIAFQMGGRISL